MGLAVEEAEASVTTGGDVGAAAAAAPAPAPAAAATAAGAASSGSGSGAVAAPRASGVVAAGTTGAASFDLVAPSSQFALERSTFTA